ncbi:DUF222 domain-containing protein [Gordonia sp. PDNC005]|uniref:HNH endonuclease signature motif containing protein n=1 Tax=unclassified Gordonia (in: high G+C Gram-positive bacteria) TaxID=2657482 RepID=UPI001966218F|nr:HNH endonuclease signature motif containing protein [Gordonia sp. PDNC005]QRY61347.1 DUF222 domain-containing protein [Gordonia sp. PDNC005]
MNATTPADRIDLNTLGTESTGNDFDDMGSYRTLWAAESNLMWRRLQLVIAVLSRRTAGIVGDDSESDRLLLDAETVLGAEVAALMSMSDGAGRTVVDNALEARDRLVRVANLLRDGLISVASFREIILQCKAIVDADVMAVVDAEIATEIREGGSVSKSDAASIARRHVAETDPDAVRDARQARGKGVTVSHDGDESVLTIAADAEQVLLAKKAVDASAAELTCTDDSRSVGARRADLAIARLTGGEFTCNCGNPECPAAASDAEAAERFARVVVHVVADASTLNGESDKAGWMDGYGVIDANHVREAAARPDATVRPLDMSAIADNPAQAGNPYRPTAATDTAVRAVHGTCSVPGCTRAAWSCDLDHVTEYNHADPATGGATCPCNLAPKCRFHHLVKTFVDGWLDDLVIDANGVIWVETVTPSGQSVRTRAANQWLVPGLGLLPCRHGAPVQPGTPDRSEPPQRSATRAATKHAYRMRLRSQRRFARACAEAEAKVLAGMEFNSAGEPPF